MTVSQEYADQLESENEDLQRQLKKQALDDALEAAGVEVEGKCRRVVYNELLPRLTTHDGDVVATDGGGNIMEDGGGDLAGPGALVDEIQDDPEWSSVLGTSERDPESRADELNRRPGPGRQTGTDPEKEERRKELNRQGKPWN